MTAKTDAQRNAALRDRRKALGLKRVEVWCHPDFAPLVRNYVAEHIRMRAVITDFSESGDLRITFGRKA